MQASYDVPRMDAPRNGRTPVDTRTSCAHHGSVVAVEPLHRSLNCQTDPGMAANGGDGDVEDSLNSRTDGSPRRTAHREAGPAHVGLMPRRPAPFRS